MKLWWKCIQKGAERALRCEGALYWMAYRYPEPLKRLGDVIGDRALRVAEHAEKRRFELIRDKYNWGP